MIAGADAAVGRDVFFAGTEFARFLIDTGALVEVSEDEALPDDVVIYLDDLCVPKHAGKIGSEHRRIKSKWGGGLFLEHGLWEVPESYGNTVKFFRVILTDKAEQAFLEFVRLQEGSDEFLELYDLKDIY